MIPARKVSISHQPKGNADSAEPQATTPDCHRLRREADRVRNSGVLGEARLARLFDYLLENSIAGVTPKEITIALDVFGKDASFDVSQDALVRVYVHKIRRALETFYKSPSADGIFLYLPRGDYRLALAVPHSSPPTEPPPKDWRIRPITCALGLVAAVLLGGSLTFAVLHERYRQPMDVAEVQKNPVWQRLLNDDRPLLIVVGDYYLFGETDSSMEVRRLLREYSVNSRNDLENFLKLHPDLEDRYVDVGLHYLPTATAFALNNVVPVVGGAHRRVQLLKMSDLNPDALKSSDIIYVGYLSGLGLLHQLVFSGSRFAVGDSFDELTDTKAHRAYISQTASQSGGAMEASGRALSYHDYGYFASFLGPAGNPIIIISGTRDEGVRQTADAVTSPEKLRELQENGAAGASLEALYEVRALNGVNLAGQLLVESQR